MRRANRSVALLLAAVLGGGMIIAPRAAWPVFASLYGLAAPEPSQDERAIWAAVIEEYRAVADREHLSIAVNPMSEGPRELPYSGRAGNDFVLRNLQPTILRCVLPPRFFFVPRASVHLPFDPDEFSAAERVGGYLTLSRAGIDPFADRAVVFVWFQCGGLCGRDTYVALRKRDGKWSVFGTFGGGES